MPDNLINLLNFFTQIFHINYLLGFKEYFRQLNLVKFFKFYFYDDFLKQVIFDW